MGSNGLSDYGCVLDLEEEPTLKTSRRNARFQIANGANGMYAVLLPNSANLAAGEVRFFAHLLDAGLDLYALFFAKGDRCYQSDIS